MIDKGYLSPSPIAHIEQDDYFYTRVEVMVKQRVFDVIELANTLPCTNNPRPSLPPQRNRSLLTLFKITSRDTEKDVSRLQTWQSNKRVFKGLSRAR